MTKLLENYTAHSDGDLTVTVAKASHRTAVFLFVYAAAVKYEHVGSKLRSIEAPELWAHGRGFVSG